jgi:hypothetical protein
MSADPLTDQFRAKDISISIEVKRHVVRSGAVMVE